jgi:gluconokinase
MLPAPRFTLILLTGVAGTGKTTIGRQLAAELGWPYHEADDFHSSANKEKMGRGEPLDDSDRAPWLAAIRAAMDECRAAGRNAVFTCSALKASYRRVLLDGAPDTALVFLSGDPAMLQTRLAQRSGHYMKPAMLESQLAILEPPGDALALDVRQTPEELVAKIRRMLSL